MKLVIHDLNAAEWAALGGRFDGWRAVSDNGAIRPCVGCFACWDRTPGACVIRDGYGDMGALLHGAEEVTVVSRYTHGGFSGFVKNVFDRSLGYVLPQFEVVKGETHHRRRYDEDKPITFIFHGRALDEEEQASARRYVTAVCANLRAHVRAVEFWEDGTVPAPVERPAREGKRRLVLLNGSMRAAKGNSAKLARKLMERTRRPAELVHLKDGAPSPEAADTLVLCVPLYVDGLPAQVVRMMERMEREYRGVGARVYVLANMGLYESRQLASLFDAVRQWCRAMGFDYCGGLGVSAGELLGVLMERLPFRLGATRRAALGIDALARAIDGGKAMADVYAEPFLFPRRLYLWIANVNWNRLARQNGIPPRALYRRLEELPSEDHTQAREAKQT